MGVGSGNGTCIFPELPPNLSAGNRNSCNAGIYVDICASTSAGVGAGISTCIGAGICAKF